MDIFTGQTTWTSPMVKQPRNLWCSNNRDISTDQTTTTLHWSNNPDTSSGQMTKTSPVVKQPGHLQRSNDPDISSGQTTRSSSLVKQLGRLQWLNNREPRRLGQPGRGRRCRKSPRAGGGRLYAEARRPPGRACRPCDQGWLCAGVLALTR